MDYLSLFHWSFVAIALAVATLANLVSKILKQFPKKKWFDLFTDGRVVPAVFGFAFGWIPGIPAPEAIEYGISSALYFLTAGIVSAWVYSLLEKIFREFLPEKIKNWLEGIFGSKKKKPEDQEED